MKEYPTCKEHYCNGCSECYRITYENWKKYLWTFVTAYPDEYSVTTVNSGKCEPYSIICTIICCPLKLLVFVPYCPYYIFCPKIC